MGLLFGSDMGSVSQSEFAVLSMKMRLRGSFEVQVFKFSFF